MSLSYYITCIINTLRFPIPESKHSQGLCYDEACHTLGYLYPTVQVIFISCYKKRSYIFNLAFQNCLF